MNKQLLTIPLTICLCFCTIFAQAQQLQTEQDTLLKKKKAKLSTTKSAGGSGAGSSGLAPVSMPIMPSPTAASLVRNATASPNLYTGAVNVSIPLYTLPAQGMSIPIGLVYQSNGVKVNEKNGPLGMSWSLQGGGAVARIVRGYPDEFEGDVHVYEWKENKEKRKKDKKIKVTGAWYDTSYPKLTEEGDSDTQFESYKEYIEFFTNEKEQYDTEKDRYVFSAPGLSGSFYLPYDRDPIVHCDEHVVVHPYLVKGTHDAKLKGFSIKKADGTLYIFGMSEDYWEEQTYEVVTTKLTTHQHQEEHEKYRLVSEIDGDITNEKVVMDTPYRSAWYLKEILLPYAQDKVQYHYEQTETITELQGNGVTLELDDVNAWGIDKSGKLDIIGTTSNASDPDHIIQDYQFSKTITTTIKPKRLIRIASSIGNLNFSYDANNVVRSIAIGCDDASIKHFNFGYKNVTSRIPEPNDTLRLQVLVKGEKRARLFDSGLTTKLPNDNLNTRLFLKDIYEVSASGSDSINIFHFDYNKPDFLPQRCSKFQNSFGFYRKYTHFKEHFISEDDYHDIQKNPEHAYYNQLKYHILTIGGERDWNYNESSPETGMLKSYKNATGAVTSFKYLSKSAGAFLSESTTRDGEKVIQNLKYEYDFDKARAPYGVYSFEYRTNRDKKGYNIWCGTESAFTQGAYYEFERVNVISGNGRMEYTFTSPSSVRRGKKIFDNQKSECKFFDPQAGNIVERNDIDAGRPCNRVSLRGKPLRIVSYNKNNVPIGKQEYHYKVKSHGLSKKSSSFLLTGHNNNADDPIIYIAENSLEYYYLVADSIVSRQYAGKDMKTEFKTKMVFSNYHGNFDEFDGGDFLFNTPLKTEAINFVSNDTIVTELDLLNNRGRGQQPSYLLNHSSTFKNRKQIAGSKIIYDEQTRYPKEAQAWVDGKFETVKYYDKLDKGKILQMRGKDLVPISYRYNKKGRLELIAKNAKYDDIAEGTVEELRTRDALKDAHIESINYTKGGMVENTTDVNGIINRYAYDDFGRLKLVSDKDHNAVLAYEYQYGKVGTETVNEVKLGIGQMVIGETFVVGGYTQSESIGQEAAGKNYIANYTFKTEGASYQDRNDNSKAAKQIQYQDGAGRTIQQVAVKSLPQEYSLVQAFKYDSLGRQPVQYRPLPFLGGDRYNKNWESALKSTFNEAYKAETEFDDFNRVHKQGSYGSNYSVKGDHASTTNYGVNSDTIISYTITLGSEKFEEKIYKAGSLLRSSVSFEGVTQTSYTNDEGKLIRKAIQRFESDKDVSHAASLITDYVYDDYGNLRAIIPPQARGDISKSKYVYKFHYDKRNRLVKKEIPGAGSITMEYDHLDRLIRETDAKGVTTYIKYDALSRPVETGYIKQLTANSDQLSEGKEVILSRTYYDNYDFPFAAELKCEQEHAASNKGRVCGSEVRVLGTNTFVQSATYYDEKGRIIEVVSKNNKGGIDRIASKYDFSGKVIESNLSKAYGSRDTRSIQKAYNYGKAGELLSVEHNVDGKRPVVLSAFTYKNNGALASKKLHDGKIRTDYSYDELDRMVKTNTRKLFELELAYDTKLKGTNNTQRYDGNLSAMAWKTPGFKRHTYSFEYDDWKNLRAANSNDHSNTSEYMYDRHGNLTMLKRRDKACEEDADVFQHFEYAYDNSNQLMRLWRRNTQSVEVWPGDTNNDGKVDVDDQHDIGYYFGEMLMQRDEKGTEWKGYRAITRKGDTRVFADTNGDGMIFSNDSTVNGFTYITDTIVDGIGYHSDITALSENLLKTHKVEAPKPTEPFHYQYDENGNMVYDQYKKLRISYNIFNLPDTIRAEGKGMVVNQYLADGTLIKRTIFDEDDNPVQVMDYQGEFLYVNDTLNTIFTGEGYYKPKSKDKTKASEHGTYYYTLTDHLGHTRVVLDEDENLVQETAYYPFGMPIAELSSKTKFNYLYTGKEFLENFDLNWYDHHARYYDPEVGRWWAIDPALQGTSPYVAMGNNPMIYIDADGRVFKKIGNALKQAWDYVWGKGDDFAKWADENGIPSVEVGLTMNSGGQISPQINGQQISSGTETIASSVSERIDYQLSQFESPAPHTGVTGGAKLTRGYVEVGPLSNGIAWWHPSIYDDHPSFQTLEGFIAYHQRLDWYQRSSGRVDMVDSPIDYLLGAGIGKALVNSVRGTVVRRAVATSGGGYLTNSMKALPQGMVPNAGGKIITFTTEKTSKFYRVYSNTPNGGAFLTKNRPKSSALAREGLALPDSNKASFIQEVIVPKGVTLQRSRTLGAFGRRGGLEQFQILNFEPSVKFMQGVPLK